MSFPLSYMLSKLSESGSKPRNIHFKAQTLECLFYCPKRNHWETHRNIHTPQTRDTIEQFNPPCLCDLSTRKFSSLTRGPVPGTLFRNLPLPFIPYETGQGPTATDQPRPDNVHLGMAADAAVTRPLGGTM